MKILNRDCVNFLVIDDDPSITEFLSVYLKQKGHTCATLTEGFSTATWLELHDCEVVVVDLKMPKVDGISLITYIREIQPSLPIVVFTGVGYEETSNARRLASRGKRLREQKPADGTALLRPFPSPRDLSTTCPA